MALYLSICVDISNHPLSCYHYWLLLFHAKPVHLCFKRDTFNAVHPVLMAQMPRVGWRQSSFSAIALLVGSSDL